MSVKPAAAHYVKLLVPDEAREFGALLWEISSKWCHFADDADERPLISYGRGVDQVVEAVLLESDEPLHYSEIAIKAAARSGREMDERRVHNSAAEVGHLFGSGIYGMLKHLSVPRAIWESLAEEAAEIVAEATLERQWHTSELIDALEGRGVGLAGRRDGGNLAAEDDAVAARFDGIQRPLRRDLFHERRNRRAAE